MKSLPVAEDRGRRALFWGLLGFLFLLPLEALTQTGQGFNWIHVWGVVLSLAWIVQLIVAEQRLPRLDRATWPFMLYVGWAVLSISWSAIPELAARTALLSVWLVVLHALVVDQVDSRSRLTRAILALLAGGCLSIVWGICLGTYEQVPRLMLVAWQSGTTAYGYPLALTMSALGAAVLCGRGRARLVAFAFYLGGLYPVIAVGLRGAMVALVLGLGAVALLTGNARRKAPLALLLILLIPSSIKLLERTAQLPEQVVDHVTLKDEGGPQEMARLQFQGTTALRFKIWQVALETFKEAPFTGVGLSQFVLEARERVELRHRSVGPHNAYLGTLAELGLVGLILLLWGECIIAVYLLRHRLLPSHDQGHAVHAILLALFVTALVGGVFSTLVRLKMLWVTCALVIAATRYCLWSQSGSPTTPPLQASVAVGADDRKEARCGS